MGKLLGPYIFIKLNCRFICDPPPPPPNPIPSQKKTLIVTTGDLDLENLVFFFLSFFLIKKMMEHFDGDNIALWISAPYKFKCMITISVNPSTYKIEQYRIPQSAIQPIILSQYGHIMKIYFWECKKSYVFQTFSFPP
jgi:hypothetical protein